MYSWIDYNINYNIVNNLSSPSSISAKTANLGEPNNFHNNINYNINNNNYASNNGQIKNIDFSHHLMNDNLKLINVNSNKTIEENQKPCGIINYGNNCYLNSGLQILVTCDKFVKVLEKYKTIKTGFIGLINEAFNKILNGEIYHPSKFLEYFCKIHNELVFAQYCSQTFIRTLLNDLNKDLNLIGDKHYINEYMEYEPQNEIEKEKYNSFMESNNFFPESLALNLFSGMTKSLSYGRCKYCQEYIKDYCFSYFIDQNIYLDDININCNFSSVLSQNLKNYNNLTLNCPKCHQEINIFEETKIIKLPEILIFTLERYKEKINNTFIKPDEIIEMKEYLDTSVKFGNTKYSLFAINIRFGDSKDFGHEICQVKRNHQWYEINDTDVYKRTREYNCNSCGLFYKRI